MERNLTFNKLNEKVIFMDIHLSPTFTYRLKVVPTTNNFDVSLLSFSFFLISLPAHKTVSYSKINFFLVINVQLLLLLFVRW